MADGVNKEAQVRLRLDSSEYIVELKRVGDENEKVAKKGKKGFLDMGKGIDAVKNELKGVGGKLREVTTMALTMGGAFSMGMAIKNTMALQTQLVGLQNEMERATGRTVDLRDIQEDLERAGAKTGRTTVEMVGAMNKLREVDFDFATSQLETVGTAANAANEPVEAMAFLAVDLKQKFGLANDEMQDAMASVVNGASKAGLKTSVLAEELGSIASAGQAAGLKGAEGMNFLLTTIGKIRPKVKDIAEAGQGIEQTFEKLSDPGFLQNLEKASGTKLKINLDEDSLQTRLRKVLGNEKARNELFAGFTGREEKATLEALADPFTEAFQKAKDAGAKTKAATEAGLEAYDEAIRQAARSTGDYADLQKQAQRQLETPEAKLRMAIERLQLSFQRPEMIRAIDTMAEKLPALAEGLAKLLEFAMSNPITAGSLAVGGKMGMTFAQASMAGGVKRKIEGFMKFPEASADKAGAAVGKSFLRKAANESAWKGVGRSIAGAAGPIMAAAVAAQIGKELIDNWADNEKKKQDEASRSEIQTLNLGSMSKEEIETAMARSRKALEKEKADKPGAFRDVMDFTFGEAGQSRTDHMKRMQGHKHFLASAEMQLQVLKDRDLNAQAVARPAAPKEGGKGTGKVEVQNLGMLAHHMGQGIAQRELRVRVVNLPASGFEVEGGSRGPAHPGAPSPSGGVGGT